MDCEKLGCDYGAVLFCRECELALCRTCDEVHDCAAHEEVESR